MLISVGTLYIVCEHGDYMQLPEQMVINCGAFIIKRASRRPHVGLIHHIYQTDINNNIAIVPYNASDRPSFKGSAICLWSFKEPFTILRHDYETSGIIVSFVAKTIECYCSRPLALMGWRHKKEMRWIVKENLSIRALCLNPFLLSKLPTSTTPPDVALGIFLRIFRRLLSIQLPHLRDFQLSWSLLDNTELDLIHIMYNMHTTWVSGSRIYSLKWCCLLEYNLCYI
jgi:hypothetical protein